MYSSCVVDTIIVYCGCNCVVRFISLLLCYSAFHERSGLAAAQAKSADIVHGTEQHSRQQGSRECVIS